MHSFSWASFAFCALLLSSVALIGCRAEQDDVEGEIPQEHAGKTEQAQAETESEPEQQFDGQYGPSPDVQSTFLFTNLKSGPSGRELVAGQIVKFLAGLANKGEKDIIVKTCETSFRYPMDFSYHIQNFSAVRYERLVQPREEATFDYAFIPSDMFIGRPLGLVVNLHYVDTDGQYYVSAVFNETITIVEDDTGFNTETYFMYLILAGFIVVLFLIGQHFFSKFTRGGGGSKSSTQTQKSSASVNSNYEMGTNKNDVDFEWIPRSHLEKKSPKLGSPRNRKQQQQAANAATASSGSS